MSEAQRIQSEMTGLVEIYRLKGELLELSDERDRLRDELDIYRQAVQYVFEAINKFNDIQRKKAALTPAEGGQDEQQGHH